MKINLFSAAAIGAAASLLLAQSAGAQAAQGASYGLTGNVSGVCFVFPQGMLADSLVGKSIIARMKQLQATATAEISAEGATFEADKKAFETAAQAAKTPAAQQPLQARAQTLQTRFEALQRKEQLRNAELQQTQAKAIARVGDAARPLIRSVANSKSCGLVLDSNSVADANPAMDITAAVVQQLNTTLPSITFDREHLDTAAGASQGR